jgi:hypothetical protein
MTILTYREITQLDGPDRARTCLRCLSGVRGKAKICRECRQTRTTSHRAASKRCACGASIHHTAKRCHTCAHAHRQAENRAAATASNERRRQRRLNVAWAWEEWARRYGGPQS